MSAIPLGFPSVFEGKALLRSAARRTSKLRTRGQGIRGSSSSSITEDGKGWEPQTSTSGEQADYDEPRTKRIAEDMGWPLVDFNKRTQIE